MAERQFFGLKMRQLPKPEYALMRALIKQYSLQDESELFATLLRLACFVERFTIGETAAGRLWILEAIETLRSMPESARSVEYTARESQ